MTPELKAKILKALELAESVAKSVVDYCSGDSWMYACTVDERKEFAELHEQLKEELKENLNYEPDRATPLDRRARTL